MQKKIIVSTYGSNLDIIAGTAGAGKNCMMMGRMMQIGQEHCAFILVESSPERVRSILPNLKFVMSVVDHDKLSLGIRLAKDAECNHVFIEYVCAPSAVLLCALNELGKAHNISVVIGMSLNRDGSMPKEIS